MLSPVAEPLSLDDLAYQLKSGGWCLEALFPAFREALLQELESTNPVTALTTLPTCLLSSLLYRKELPATRSEQGTATGTPRVEVVDAHSIEATFWENVVKDIIDPNATVASATEADLAFLSETLLQIESTLPDLKGAFNHIRHFVIFEGTFWLTASQPHFAGCIFVNKNLMQSPLLAENIVHELAHQEVFCLNLIDRLVSPEADEKWTYAPFQRCSRPTIGRLHAAHALYRTCQYYDATTNNPAFDKGARCLEDTLNTFTPEDLSSLGYFLVSECYPKITNSMNKGKLHAKK